MFGLTPPLDVLVALFLAFTLGTWLLSVLTREYSWVDRIWSVAPPVYAAAVAGLAGFADARLNLMAALVVAWGTRLTFNFWRRGGYAKGGEDYRWAILRAKMSAWQFQLFNATFIAPYQNLLLLLISLPMVAAWGLRGEALGPVDALFAVLFLAALALETLADQQQYDFQTAKYAARARGEAVAANFRTTGLWRYSRHPNFFFEQAQWWILWAWSVAAGAPALPALAGPVLLTLLFLGSTRFTESITLAKYPEYADYQASTSMLVPWPPAASPRAEAHRAGA